MGGIVRAWRSPDGVNWTRFDLVTMTGMSSPLYVGLAVTSHDTELPAGAVFSNVTLNGTAFDQAQDQDVGLVTNSAEPIYVTLNDGAPVYHGDPAATQIDGWTQWSIPLQTFAAQGVSLSQVSKMTIGVGTKGGSAPGGSGRLYIDDIRLYRPPVVPGGN